MVPAFLTAQPFAPAAALEAFTASVELAGPGAIVSFSGHVRPHAHGAPVTTLRLQAHPRLTEQGIAEAGADAAARWPLQGWTITHRIGDMAPGDTIVFVATASAHRRAAFEAADYLMDYLKTSAIFWKQEVRNGTSEWIEPRPEDYTDRDRWTQSG
ncbi:MAG: molybdenum cofactor biosynthesis protein MoaE [Pseudomonadota bacterium]